MNRIQTNYKYKTRTEGNDTRWKIKTKPKRNPENTGNTHNDTEVTGP